MYRVAAAAMTAVLFAAPPFAASQSADEKAAWSMEENYWQYVRANDLEHYRTLWDITDWIAAHADKGLRQGYWQTASAFNTVSAHLFRSGKGFVSPSEGLAGGLTGPVLSDSDRYS